MDRGAWWAIVHGVTVSRTRLKWLSTHARENHLEWDVAVSPCHLQEKKHQQRKLLKKGSQKYYEAFCCPLLHMIRIIHYTKTQLETSFGLIIKIQYLWPEKPAFKNHLCLHWWLRQWRISLQCRKPKLNPWIGKIPWRREWQPTPVFLPGESHGQGSLAG